MPTTIRLSLLLVTFLSTVASTCGGGGGGAPAEPEPMPETEPADAPDEDPCILALCPQGTHCEPVDVQCVTAPCPPVAECVQDEPTCDGVECSDGFHCEVLQVQCITQPCPPLASCVADGCNEFPPANAHCIGPCETGYAIVDGNTTCGCCSPEDEPSWAACLDDADCPSGEGCDDAFCDPDPDCVPGDFCTALCYGRCTTGAALD